MAEPGCGKVINIYIRRVQVTMKKTFKLLFNISLFLISLAVMSCSGGGIGYGVVLWPENNSPLAAGKIYTVKAKSDINESYFLQLEDTKDTIEAKRWRMEFLDKKTDAESFAQEFSKYAYTYGRAEEDGLTLREEPSTSGRQIYRARKAVSPRSPPPGQSPG